MQTLAASHAHGSCLFQSCLLQLISATIQRLQHHLKIQRRSLPSTFLVKVPGDCTDVAVLTAFDRIITPASTADDAPRNRDIRAGASSKILISMTSLIDIDVEFHADTHTIPRCDT